MDMEEAKTSVWWDVDVCRVPDDGSCDPYSIAHNIASVLNLCGPLSIFAYGDIQRIPFRVHQALSATGITLNQLSDDAPQQGSSFSKILVDMLFWAVDNPPPANLILISGGWDFSYALHQLSIRRYKIILVQPCDASGSLVTTSKNVMSWTRILAGVPLLSDGELSQSEPGSKSVQMRHHAASSSVDNLRASFNGKGGDSASKGKQIWSDSSHVDKSRTSGLNVCVQALGNGTTKQSSSPKLKKCGIAPHEFNTTTKCHTYSAPNSLIGNPDYSVNNGNGLEDIQQNLTTQKNVSVQTDLALSQKKLPVQPNFAPDKFFQRDMPIYGPLSLPAMPNGSAATCSTCTSIPMEHPENSLNPLFLQENGDMIQNSNFESLNLASDFHNANNITSSSYGVKTIRYHHRGSVYPNNLSLGYNTDPGCCSGVWGTPGCPAPPEHVQCLIGIILLALYTLESEKMIPTEVNIADCIRYGGPAHRNIDVGVALNCAIEQQMIVRLTSGYMEVFVRKNAPLWKCVNPLGGSLEQYPKEMWNGLQQWLSSPDGQFKMMVSEGRYEAALCLRESCLKGLALGEVFQILNIIITIKKWIIVDPSGWQPISITIAD